MVGGRVNTFTKNSSLFKLIKMQQNLYVAKIVIFVKQEINKQTKNSVYAAVGGNRMSLCRLKLVEIGCDVSTVASRLSINRNRMRCPRRRSVLLWRQIANTMEIHRYNIIHNPIDNLNTSLKKRSVSRVQQFKLIYWQLKKSDFNTIISLHQKMQDTDSVFLLSALLL